MTVTETTVTSDTTLLTTSTITPMVTSTTYTTVFSTTTSTFTSILVTTTVTDIVSTTTDVVPSPTNNCSEYATYNGWTEECDREYNNLGPLLLLTFADSFTGCIDICTSDFGSGVQILNWEITNGDCYCYGNSPAAGYGYTSSWNCAYNNNST